MGRTPKQPATTSAEPPADTTTSRAIIQSKYESLMRRCIAGEKERAADAAAARQKIGEAVEKDNLHAKAFSWTKMLKKMTQTKRDELVFHLMTYFKYEGWPGEDMLADRAPKYGGEPCLEEEPPYVEGPPLGAEPSEEDPADERDLRPRHLRSGSSDPDPAIKH